MSSFITLSTTLSLLVFVTHRDRTVPAFARLSPAPEAASAVGLGLGA
jgi:hypothetical protein